MAITDQLQPASLDQAMRDAAVKPLWVHYRDLASRQPDRMEPPMHWRWANLQGAIDRASSEIGMEDAERRVLVLSNPAFEPKVQTTGNLIGALQILNPGDNAHEHRHSMAALRMILDAEGGYTSVDGQQYEMHNGDLILTPAWTWHGHDNATAHRVIWFDGLDVPFVRSSLDAGFFEPHPPANFSEMADGLAEQWRWADHGLSLAGRQMETVPHSPRIHYPWTATAAMLDKLEPGDDGHVLMRYIHPQTGGAIMPTLDCFMLRLQGSAPSTQKRSTSNAVCVVLEGEGVSRVGDSVISWKKNDIFTVPHWTWATHQSSSDRAHVFMMTDAEIFRRLGLYKEEVEKIAL